jgi:hypothetical protein
MPVGNVKYNAWPNDARRAYRALPVGPDEQVAAWGDDELFHGHQSTFTDIVQQTFSYRNGVGQTYKIQVITRR